jgi:hypothetical protein
LLARDIKVRGRELENFGGCVFQRTHSRLSCHNLGRDA